jgi:hypothetical protein
MATTTYGIYSPNRRKAGTHGTDNTNRRPGGTTPITKAKPAGPSMSLPKRRGRRGR